MVAALVAVLWIFSSSADAGVLHDSTGGINPTGAHAAAFRKFEHLTLPDPETRRLDSFSSFRTTIPDSTGEERAHAHALLQKVLSGQRFLESLDALSEIDLPIGVVRSGTGLDYTILIDRMEFTREGAVMDVYVSLALPQANTRLAFHGRVPLSAGGGVAANARVFLIGDHVMPVGTHAMLTVKGDRRTYVEFDCNGFVGVHVDAELAFSTDLLVAEEPDPDRRLTVAFSTYTQSLNDILVGVQIPPFRVAGLNGFTFAVTEAYIDWSDMANPSSLVFPSTYTSPFITGGLDNLWHGLYLKELRIVFPKAFARRADTSRVAVAARHMIIDDTGITGELSAHNVFQDGDMNGWTYSLDKAGLQLTANRVTGFMLEGKLSIPVIQGRDGKDTQFGYVAERGADGSYLFAVGVENDLRLDLWLADMKLGKGSRVVVAEKEGRFYPSAHLNGELSINLTSKGPKASFNSIRFENMVISSEAPHFRPGTFGFGRENQNAAVSRYPVVIDNITVKSEDKKAGLAFDLIINIGGKPEDEAFAGKANLVIWGAQDTAPRRTDEGVVIGAEPHRWAFEKAVLSSVKININKPKIIELAGEVRFFEEDRVYGDGFKGRLKGKIQAIAVEAEALFGRTETFRYWYADALIEFKTGIPVMPGVLSAYGFGGGYYSKMKQSDAPLDGTLGRSPSGVTYIPDENAIGIRAIVLIGTPRPEAMRGDVSLEVNINRHGGVNSITFTGNASFMTAESLGAKQIRELTTAAVSGQLTEQLNSLIKGQVFGKVKLHFDNLNDVFHGNLEVFVNVAGGIVRGVSEGNKAGWAVLHFEQSNWYIHIGTPDQPIGLEVARLFKAKSYFMLGKNLPGSPPPPPQVTEILGDVDLDYMRDLNALESGMGIAFGLHFLVDTGDLRFLIFYGRFSAGTGLDFMLKDYGNEYHCAGRSGPMGISGWYANGQAYAFVMGKIGIQINLKFYKGQYEILNIGAAAVLQAKGPNPFWMKGTVGGYYRILGGLVEGRCRFEVTIGTECKPVVRENLLEEVTMIAGITPANLSTEISVFNVPQVVFNIPVGETFAIHDMENQTHYFRAALSAFSLTEGGRQIDGTLRWNDDHTVVAFDPENILPGDATVTARATLAFEERINGIWKPVRFNANAVVETAETQFETAHAPDHIPESNVAFSYPVNNQTNFHPGEYTQGFVQLRAGQPYLFVVGSEWTQKVRFTDRLTGRMLETTLAYHHPTRRLVFDIPEGMERSRAYTIEVLNVPTNVTQIDGNVTSVSRELVADASGSSATLTTQSAEGNLEQQEINAIFSLNFRTSKYRTFVEKMKDISLSPVIRLSPGINIFQLTSYFRGDELFDESEMGSPFRDGFIHLEAVLDGNTWYQRHVHPLLYQDYPLLGWMTVTRRDPVLLGIPPVRDVYVENVKSTTPSPEPVPFTDEYLVYNLGQSVASDFYDLQRHAVNYIADGHTNVTHRIKALVTAPLPYVRYGRYKIQFNYVIPGIDQKTSSYEMQIFNRIPDSD